MILTSGPAEIALSSSRVPGYWAREAGGENEFFLYTKDRSYEKGNRVKVEGPFGGAYASVYRNESGEYLRGCPMTILVVWKMARAGGEEGQGTASRGGTDRAPRP